MPGRFSPGIVIFFSGVLSPILAQEYVISTIAGGSPPPVHAVLATAVAAGMPYTDTADRQGNVYFASTGTNTVYKVDSRGMLTRVAGYATPGFSGDGGPASEARLLLDVGPYGQGGVAVDADGNLLIADTGNHRVRRVSSDGTIATIAGNGYARFLGRRRPCHAGDLELSPAVTTDSAGNVYVSDAGNNVVRVLRPVAPDGR